MSRLIDQLRAESNDPRSDRELTLVFGDQLQQAGRTDVFDSNPDFAKEYAAIKDEISRLNRPGLGSELASGFKSGVRELGAAGLGLGALAARGVGADQTASALLGRARSMEESAQEAAPSVPSISDISGEHPLEDTAYYLARGAGGLLPSLGMGAAASAAGALAGSAVEPGGGTIAGGVGGLLEGFAGGAAKQILEAAASRGIQMSAEEATALATRQLAKRVGGEAALGAAFSGQAAGSNFIRNPETPAADLAFGVASGVLGAVAPGYVLSKLLPAAGEAATEVAAKHAMGYWNRFAEEAAKTIPIGAGTTAASALVDIAANKYSRGEDPTDFTDADWRAALNAGVIGGIGGALLSPIAAIRGREAPAEPEPKIDTSGLPPEVASAVQAVESVTTQSNANPIKETVAVPGSQTPQPASPLAEGGAAQIPEPPPPGARDAPLAQLVGREVEYAGYRGTLVRDDEGGFGLLKATPEAGKPNLVEIANTAKDPAKLGSEVGVSLFEKQPDPSWKVVASAQRGDVPGMTMVEMKDAQGTTTVSSPEQLIKQGYVLPPVESLPPGEYTIRELQTMADRMRPAEKAPLPVPSTDNVMPPPEAPVRVTIYRPQEIPSQPGVMSKAFTQIDRLINEGRGEPLTDAERPQYPTNEQILATDLPEGQHPIETVREAIAARQPEVVAKQQVDPARRQTLLDLGFSEKNIAAMDAPTADRLIQSIGRPQYTQRAAPETPEFTSWFQGSKVVDEAGAPQEMFHGTTSDIKKPSGIFWLTPDRSAAAGFADRTAFGNTERDPEDYRTADQYSPKYDTVEAAGQNVVPVYASIRNPLDFTSLGQRVSLTEVAHLLESKNIIEHVDDDALDEIASELGDEDHSYTPDSIIPIYRALEGLDAYRDIQKAGFDGVKIVDNDVNGAPIEAWATFKPEQIKSSIGNRGAFDAANPDITATARTSADFLSAPSSAANLLESTVRALAQDRGIPVAPLTKAVGEALQSAVQTAGVTIDTATGGKIVGYSLDTVHGVLNPQSVIALMHEAGHVFTDGLPEAQRATFQRAIDQLPWSGQRWLLNPQSLDVRLMAAADPAALSDVQRAALSRLTPEELAAARSIAPEQLAKERMAEHLSQLGWDRQQAVGLIDRFFRFIKDLWYQTSMTLQRALKGEAETNPELVRQFVENRFLQFINRDAAFSSERINDLLNWIGVPATTRQRQPSFPGGQDTEMRMQFADEATGTLIPISYAIYTPDAQQAYVQRAVDNAARFVRDGMTPGATAEQIQLSRRTNFSKPLPFDPEGTSNVSLASLNLEEEIYNAIRTDRNIAGLLPRINGQPTDAARFLKEWMKLPDAQTPASRRARAVDAASKTTDPLTGKPVLFDPAMTVDRLPSFVETLIGKEKEAVQVRLSEQQDEALRQAIFSLRDTQRRMQNRFSRDSERLNALIEQRDELKSDFPPKSAKELEQLQRDTLVQAELMRTLVPRISQLDAKFDPSAQVKVYPTAEYLRVPTRDADETQILGHRRGVVPRDLNFSNDAIKSAFGQDLADMKSWLGNPANREKGVIYGRIDETYRKLMQIPVDLQRVNTAAVMRRTVTQSLANELRLTGLPALVALSKKFMTATRIIGESRVDASHLGNKWNEAFGKFAESMGQAPDQAFRDNVWDSLMRVWNHIDVSKRGQIRSDAPGAPVDLVVKAMSKLVGLEIRTPAQRETLRDLMLSTIDNERWQMGVELRNDIKINDPELGFERRLIPRGLAAGRRGVARHMTGLYMRMNPDWSATSAVSPTDNRTFWQAAPDLYAENRPLFDQQMARLFPSYVTDDFVEPLANNNTPLFDAPKTSDDSTPRQAALVNVRQAWREAAGDVTKFAEQLHGLEGGDKGDERQTVANVLLRLRQRFNEIKADQDGRIGSEGIKREILPRQIMDARLAHDWPAEWVSYSTYSPADNLTLLHQLALAAGLGKDALAQNSEINLTIAESRRDLAELWARHEEMVQRGMSPKQIEQSMGEVNAKLARRYYALSENLNNVSNAMISLTTNSGYLSGDFRAFNAALGFASGMMVQNPRSGLVNIIGDIQGPLASLKFSRPGIKAFFGSGASVARDLATSFVRGAGIDVKFNTDLAHEMYVNGATDPDNFITWKQKQYNYGPSQTLAKPAGYESTVSRVGRLITRTANRGRDLIPNVGSPFQARAKAGDEQAAVAPKLRAGFFGTTALSTAFANNRAGYTAFSDLAMRGVKYLNGLPAAARDQLVRELEAGTKTLDNRQLGYDRGLLLNDEAAFNYLKDAIETKMSGESSVGRFVAKAFRRQQEAGAGKWPILANSQFSDIINLTNSDWTLQGNIATLPPWMNGPLRPLFTFLTWPYMAMQRFGKTFTDPRGVLTYKGMNSSVADGIKTFFVIAAPATVAGSFAIDLYDKYALGKKQNLREASLATALPVVGAVINPAAFMERIGRYGSAGFASDVLNRVVNYDTQRNLSLDDRIVAVSSIENLLNSVAVEPFQTGGNITYASTVRPFLQAVGAGGVLQYLQIANNLLGLNNQDAAINARINTSNYLRASGRELGLAVRVMSGPSEAPTPISPYLTQMLLGAGMDNPELFRAAYQNAVRAARDQGKANPEAYVAQAFADKHPLRALFTHVPTEGEYRQMLSLMDERGSGQVRQFVNNVNRYGQAYFKKKPFYGKVEQDNLSIDQLIRQATKQPAMAY